MGSRDSWAALKYGICVSRPQSFQLSIAAPLPQVVYWTESHWLSPLKYSVCLSVVCCFTRSSETGNDFLLGVFIRFACRWVTSMHLHAHMLLPYQGIHAKKKNAKDHCCWKTWTPCPSLPDIQLDVTILLRWYKHKFYKQVNYMPLDECNDIRKHECFFFLCQWWFCWAFHSNSMTYNENLDKTHFSLRGSF